MPNLNIKQVCARQILDSRGNPTIESEVKLECGVTGRASAPSGASTGKFEAVELRDGDRSHYGGNSVYKAVKNVNTVINEALTGANAFDTYGIDKIMIEADGTPNKSKLGANAILSVSLAAAYAAAEALGLPLYAFIGGCSANRLPVPMMNILNGGAHASNNVDVQEFMIMPIGAKSFEQGLEWCAEVFQTLKALLKADGLSTAVGDEGGFAPDLPSDERAIEYITDAINSAGFKTETDFVLALDAAASEWKGSKRGEYVMPKTGAALSAAQLIDHWVSLTEKYPVYSIEDGLDEEDWDGWAKLTQKLGKRVQLVGDDLFVTNVKRIRNGIDLSCGNSALIKLNQIGTLSETIEAVKLAKNGGFTVVISHRSGETEDVSIADLAVALNAGQIKSGAPCRSERVAKYNRLLLIERQLGSAAYYPGEKAFNIIR